MTYHKIYFWQYEVPDIPKHTFEWHNYWILKGRMKQRRMKNIPHLGCSLIASNRIVDSVFDFHLTNSWVFLLTFWFTNKIYMSINVHASINQDSKQNPEGTGIFCKELVNIISRRSQSNTQSTYWEILVPD